MIWRENRVLLSILGALLVANGIFFFTYRVQYEARLSALDAKLQDSEAQLQRARNRRRAAAQQLASYDKVRADLQTLYDRRWATKSERLTALINEIKKLAVDSQLEQPRSLTFSEAIDQNAVRSGETGTTIVTISFTVKGNYQEIRRFINHLELSNQFVIIDSINLASGGPADSALTLNLRLKSLFREAPVRKAMLQHDETRWAG